MRLRAKTQMREINEIRNSVSGRGRIELALDSASESLTGGKVQLSGMKDTFFWLISKAQMVADIPTWLGAYEKAMAELNPVQGETSADLEARAVALADQAVLDSQGGGQIKDLAQIQRGGPLMKLFTTFYSYFNVTFNLTVESVKKTDFKSAESVGRLAVDLLMLYTVPAALGLIIRQALRGGDDDESFAKKLGKEHLSYLLGTMVGFREANSAIQGFQYQGPAGMRGYAALSKLVQQLGQGEADEALWKSLNDVAGIFLHYPAGQVQRTVSGIAALQDGETANPKALLFGAPK
jgi:hypothetical protein